MGETTIQTNKNQVKTINDKDTNEDQTHLFPIDDKYHISLEETPGASRTPILHAGDYDGPVAHHRETQTFGVPLDLDGSLVRERYRFGSHH